MLPTFKLPFFALLACVTFVSADQLSKDLADAVGLGISIENGIPDFLPNGKCGGDHGPLSGDCDDLRFTLGKKDPLVKNAEGHQFLCNNDCCITAVLSGGTEQTMTQGDLAGWGYDASRKCNGPNLQSYRSALEHNWQAPNNAGVFTMCMSSKATMSKCTK